MKRLLPVLLFLFGCLCSWAQITITNATFPKVGDTIKMVYDGAPTDVNISASGADQNWDFRKLQGITRHSQMITTVKDKSMPAFSNSNMTGRYPVDKQLFFKTTDTRLELVGVAGNDPMGLGVKVHGQYTPPLTERRTPLSYKDKNESNSKIAFAFSSNELPQKVINDLPINPDSVRFRIAIKREDVVDAWGVLSIPGGDYEVLREKRTEIRSTSIDTKMSPLPWLDVTDVVGNQLDYLGQDTIITYYYYSEEEIEPIAIVKTRADGKKAIAVEYKANKARNNIRYVNRGRADLLAYPNPAIEEVRFEFLNLPRGKYDLTIYNILGVEVWQRDYLILKDKTIKVDLTDFRKGTYLYSLVNEKGKTITTKRLVILRP